MAVHALDPSGPAVVAAAVGVECPGPDPGTAPTPPAPNDPPAQTPPHHHAPHPNTPQDTTNLPNKVSNFSNAPPNLFQL
ncbi:hypothetical protein KIMC2_02890 [Xylocopilactobacillus apis]|uniref:Uncharacterized protein n=1 Tax=Xylocopilactobacillus apis TaxID=2932183 RepID=A0AAU9D4I3_9LACO|nr:hypothetical protein KIMC2_02890 [Xylocopilactobacillus apis]